MTKLSQLADEIRKNRKAKEKAEKLYKAAEAALIDRVTRIYTRLASNGNLQKSVDVEGKTTEGVKVTFADSFLEIPIDKKAALQELDEKFDEHFESSRTITLAKTDDESVSYLLETLGPKKFNELFNVKVVLKPTKGYDKIQFSMSQEVQDIVKQKKPTVKKL